MITQWFLPNANTIVDAYNVMQRTAQTITRFQTKTVQHVHTSQNHFEIVHWSWLMFSMSLSALINFGAQFQNDFEMCAHVAQF